ncbi:hypothetical protein GCK72_015690 [Caenorhabditis remanei]|uniref:EGF-like domain-containing protein n=1 Tax=Caenorhabditis remanei TaxID=31234 RepID=A0A6A5GXC2_CAERE|nr:hypothetical protein GCK72_015690 [Caenorhabditis remanei]KAF1759229.1 hypothetical protein GCK72_015690 [Caenorhabditis remanei]
MEILIESGASIHAELVVTYENKSQVTWRQLKADTPEFLTFDGFNISRRLLNITIHDNVTSSSLIFVPNKNHDYAINDLPPPFVGFQMKFGCAKNGYGAICERQCTTNETNKRCNEHGMLTCSAGHCGADCEKSGTQCSFLFKCNCKNDGRCYVFRPRSSDELAVCECPPGYFGYYCERFKQFDKNLTFSTNFGKNLMVPNKFSNLTETCKLFEKYEGKTWASGHQVAQKYQSFWKLTEISMLIWVVGILGYCIIECCGKSENKKENSETSKAERKKTSEEVEINNM